MHIVHRLLRSHVYVILVSLFAVYQIPIVGEALAANGSVAYTYDALGRVTTASYDTGACIIYSYDANGNRTSETILVSSSGSTGYWGCFNWNERNWGAS